MDTNVKRPRILLSTASNQRVTGLRRTDTVGGKNYAQAIAEAGGLPYFVANLDPSLAEDYVAETRGLLLTGGADFDPETFGQDPHADLGRVDYERDDFELALYKAAKAKGIPILGICRGIQAINIAEGGTLHQHVPAAGATVQHEQRNIDGTPSHKVVLEPDSFLAKAYGSFQIKTNSYHHQAIDKLGEGLRIVGRSNDGTIEAVEGIKSGNQTQFVAGVQWHPEMSFEKHPEHLAPFKLFMAAVKEELVVSSL